jgi:hypothetical protein
MEIETSTEILGFPESVHVKTRLTGAAEDSAATDCVRLLVADAAVGLPLIIPVEAARDRPAGSAPDLMIQLNGDDPPCTKAARLIEKG